MKLKGKASRSYFQLLVHLFGTDKEGVSEEIEEHLTEFLESGCEAKKIMEMLGDEYVFNNYAVFEEYGVKVDSLKIAKGLGPDFVYKKLKEFSARNIDMNKLAEEIFDKGIFCELCEHYSDKDVFANFVYCGVDVEIIFSLAGEVLKMQAEYPYELFETLDFLSQHGLKRKEAKSWLEKRLKNDDFGILRKCSFHYDNELKKFGIDIRDFTEDYLKRYGEEYLYNMANLPLPKWLNINLLVQYFDMCEIISSGSLNFIYEFEAQGGDMNMLAKKFIDEIGYPGNCELALILLVIIECGGTDGVDFESFAKAINAKDLSRENKRYFRETLSAHGVDAKKLRKFL